MKIPIFKTKYLVIFALSFLFAIIITFLNFSDQLPSLNPKFPEVSGQNLQGKSFSLPGDFKASRILIIFGYQREQAEVLSTWVKGLDVMNRDWEWYEMPVISRPLQLGSWFIDGGMRKGIPDNRLQERVITLYTDREKFCNSLGIPFNVSGAYAMAIRKSGEVVGYVEGGYSSEGAQQIERWMTAGT